MAASRSWVSTTWPTSVRTSQPGNTLGLANASAGRVANQSASSALCARNAWISASSRLAIPSGAGLEAVRQGARPGRAQLAQRDPEPVADHERRVEQVGHADPRVRYAARRAHLGERVR